jgi:hypothetical protein
VVVAETTVRDHVRRRRRELGLAAEAFCPQVQDPGVTTEIDWGETKVLIAGLAMTVGLFLMRSCFSGACLVMAFESQSQQAFLEGHVHAFEFFSGVFATCRVDYVARHIIVQKRRRRAAVTRVPHAARRRLTRRVAQMLRDLLTDGPLHQPRGSVTQQPVGPEDLSLRAPAPDSSPSIPSTSWSRSLLGSSKRPSPSCSISP